MNTTRYPHTSFSEQDIKTYPPAMKVGILGTVNPQGLPHLTLHHHADGARPQSAWCGGSSWRATARSTCCRTRKRASWS